MDKVLNSQTEDDFSKARNKALFNEIQHFLNPAESKLLSFTDIKKWLKPKNEVYMGMQEVPITHIVGSEGRYNDFDNHFFPRNSHIKNRWKSIDAAHLTDVILPPIKLYEIGGLYFVRDGNHRVSVAKSLGVVDIDAEVISLKSEIKLWPGMNKFQILKKVIDYEKRVFYTETGFGDITDDWNLDFTWAGQYDVIYNHIEVHKYYEGQRKEITMIEAIQSWYDKVYMPVVHVLEKEKIMQKFKRHTLGDMYTWLLKYWTELQDKYGEEISLDAAAQDFKNIHKISLKQKIINIFIKKNLKNKNY